MSGRETAGHWTRRKGEQVLQSEVRPWGSWEVLDVGDGFKVKRIHVNPGCRLSYQMHHHRSEHWVVLSGTATCTVDDEITVAEAGHTVDVPLNSKHRLANLGDEELVIIEVQRGHYTGEDDIVRFDDDYGRHECEPVLAETPTVA